MLDRIFCYDFHTTAWAKTTKRKKQDIIHKELITSM